MTLKTIAFILLVLLVACNIFEGIVDRDFTQLASGIAEMGLLLCLIGDDENDKR